MADNEENLLLRIEAEDDAQDELTGLAAALEALDRAEASPEVEVNTGEAQAELLGFAAALQALDDTEVEVDVDFSQLELFAKQLDSLGREVTKTFSGKFMSEAAGAFTAFAPHGEQLQMDVGVETSGLESATAQLELFSAEVERLDGREIDVNIDVDRGGGLRGIAGIIGSVISGIGALGRTAGEAAGEGSKLGGMLTSLGSSLSGVTVNLGMFGARLGPIVAGILALAVVIGTALVGALTLLAGALGIAITFAAGLAVALGGALLPAIGALVPVALSLGQVMEVLQAEQKEAATATETLAQKQREAVLYARQHADAERNLGDALRALAQTQKDSSRAIADARDAERQATESLRDATVDAYKEMEDAIESASDAALAFEGAQISADQAALNVRKADQALKDFRNETGLAGKGLEDMFKKFTDVDFRGKTGDLISEMEKVSGQKLSSDEELELEQLILNVRDARHQQKVATDGVSDATRELGRATQEANKFQTQGITASDRYTSALDTLAAARRNVTRAEEAASIREANALRAVQDARRQIGRLESDREYQIRHGNIEKSTELTRNLTGEQKNLLGALRGVWTAFQDAFGPSTSAIIEGLAEGFRAITPSIREMRGPLTTLGEAFGSAIREFFELLASPEVKSAFVALIQGAAQLAPLVGRGFGALLKILLAIAQAAMPFLVAGLEKFVGFLERIAAEHGVKDFFELFKLFEPTFNAMVELAYQLARILLNFFIAIAPYADEFVQLIVEAAEQLANWLASEEGQRELKRFFKVTLPMLVAFAKWIGRIIEFFLRLTELLAPLIKPLFDLFTVLTDIVNVFINLAAVGSEVVGRFLGFFTGLIASITDEITGFIDDCITLGADIISGLLDGIGRGVDAAWEAIKGFFESLWQNFLGFWGANSPSTLMMGLGADIILGLVEGIKSVILLPVTLITGIFSGIDFSGAITRLKNLGTRVINAIADGIRTGYEKVRNFIKSVFGIDIGPIVSRFLNFGKRIVNAVIRGVKSLARGAWNTIKDLFRLDFESIKNRFYENGKKLVNAVINGVKSLLNTAWSVIKSVFNVDLGDVIDRFFELGKAITQGLINGVKSLANTAVDTVKGVAEDAWNATTDFLGVGSPSKLFYQVGVDVGRGFELGVKSQADKIGSSAKALRAPVATSAGRGGPGSIIIEKQEVNLPPAPGHDQMGDPRHQAAQFAREMRRRGGPSVAGGGYP